MKPKVPLLALTGVLLLVAMVLAGTAVPAAQAQATAFTEPFNDASQFVTSTPFFSDGGWDYFGISDGAGGGDWGGGAQPSGLKSYTGMTGSFMTGMDLDGEEASLPVTATWTGINIDGLSSLEFSGDFAEYFDDPGDIDEANDVILVEYQIDGGGYVSLLQFVGADFDSPGYNGVFREDADFDGVGEGTALGSAAQTFVKAIPGSGSALDLRLTVWVDSGDEDFAADNFIVREAGGTGPEPAQIVINEILQNPSAVDDTVGEWFELYNAGSSDVDIEGWTIRDDGIDSHVIANSGALLVPAGGYLVLGNNADNGTNGGANVAYSYGSNWFLSNSGDEVILIDIGGVEVDRVEYDGGPVFPDPTGASMSLEDPALDNNDGTNWCTSTTSFGAGDLGTPGAVNVCDVVTPPAEIVINEIMQNPAAVGDTEGEWFELYNAGSSDVDIEGWTIRDDGSDNHVIANGGALLVPAGGYLVLGNNADNGTNGGANVAYSYGGSWYLSNSGDEVILVDTGGVEVDRVEYDGGPIFPDPTGASMSLEDPALDNNDGTNWCTSTTSFGAGDLGTPSAVNVCGGGGGPDPLAVFIHDVQGSGSSVAITDPVIVEAIVVGDYQLYNELDGFFIQEEDADADADDNTSEGIFVFCDPCAYDVAVGDKVQVTGLPEEYFDMSQIDVTGPDGLVEIVGTDVLPTPSSVDLPAAGSTVAEQTFENVEGMLVTFPDTLVVSEYFQLARFGQLVLTEDARPHQFTDSNAPSVAGYETFLNDLSTRRIILDDNTNWQNPSLGSPDTPYYWPRPGLSNSNMIRGGDSIVGLTGAMHWSWAGGSGTNAWRIRPVNEAFNYDFTSNIARPTAPPDVGGSFKVASFNVLNYFKTIDLGPDICGPLANLDCRGAHSESELMRQRDKIVAAMLAMDADVLGLMELENDADASIADLVAGLNDAAGPGAYDYIATGFIGDDAIKVGFIYKTATADPVGSYAILDTSVDPTFNDDKNRPALAQTFDEIATGGRFTAVVNHLKSKGSPCDDVGDPNLNDGQANCPQTRTDAANALVNWLATDPTASGDPDFMIIGDLNAYRMEDPIAALQTGGYTDLQDALIGSDAYTYVFDGQLGYLDYAMSNDSLTSQVAGVAAWNINADEIPLFDYNDEIQDAAEASFERESNAEPIYEANAYRASDHDPVIVGLDLFGAPLPIGEIQGAGHLSPYAGQQVTTMGIVTAQSYTGYYVQDANVDANDDTADGLFVYMGNGCSGCPDIGDEVLLTDYVSEYIAGGAATGNLSTTQISFPITTVLSTGNPLPAAVVIGTSGRIAPAVDVISRSERPVNLQTDPGVFNPDNDGIDFYEALEGMLVTIEDPVAVSGTRTYNSFSSEMFVLTNNGAHIDPTDARTARGGINLQPHLNNDGDQNPERVQIQFDGTLYPFAVPAINVGDRLGNVTGVMGYSFGNFEVNATQEVVVNPAGLETETTKLEGTKGAVTVASYNVLNLSPDASDDNQRATLASHIVNNLRSPDVIALQEIQDNSGTTDDGVTDADETLQALVDAIAAAGGPDYAFFDVAPADGASGGVPGGNIRNAYLYNPRRVKLVDFESLTPDVLSEIGVSDPYAFFGTRDPLLATFKFRGKEFKVINNHLTSRFGSTPIFGGPQPFVQAGEVERAAQTGALNEVVDALLDNGKCTSRHALLDKELLGTNGRGGQGNPPGWCDKHNASKAARVIVLGDLNTMEFTDDIKHILPGTGRDKVLTNLIDKLRDDNVYTYNFEGNSQVLDHLLVSKALRRGARFDIVHVNVDFARVDNTVGSDHEPLLVSLRIGGR